MAQRKRASQLKIANSVVQTSSICKLPANIMLNIFRHLDVKSLCTASRVCRLWYNLVSDKSLWRIVDLRPWRLPLRTLWKAVRNRLSDSVTELRVRGFIGTSKKAENVSPSLLEEIRQKCPNLEKMSLCYCDMRSVEARCFPRGLKQLCLDHSIVPLGWFDSLRQEAFFPDLLELSLTYCTRISDKDLASVSRFLGTLQHLDLSHCYRVGDTGVQSITTNLKELEYLNLSNCPGITDLSLHHVGRHLLKLKYLNLLCCRQVTDAGVNSLVHSLTSLESLILASCPEITNNALNSITECCKQLKLLNISNCFQLTESGVDSVKTLVPDCRVTGPWLKP